MLGVAHVRAPEQQVVEHGEVGEHEPLGGDERHAGAHVGLRPGAGDIAAGIDRTTALRGVDAQDRLDRRRLPAAVVAEDPDDLALVHPEVDVEHDVLAAVSRLQALDG